ncbi:MAG: hypothetical protein ACLFU6_01890 [Candidatus Hydrogenedentota bacterium]
MEIKIGKNAKKCFVCETPFVHDQVFVSRTRVQEGVLLREDYCEACWDPSWGEGAFCVWRPVFRDPSVELEEPPEAYSPLRQAFYEALESEDRAVLARAYLAAQLLKRQRVFRLIKESDESDGETRISLYVDKHGDGLIEIRDPNLSYAELEVGRADLLERLAEIEAPQEQQQAEQNTNSTLEPETSAAIKRDAPDPEEDQGAPQTCGDVTTDNAKK